jgi:flagellar hook-basal body complex protein FliE
MNEIRPILDPYVSTNVAAPTPGAAANGRNFSDYVENAVDRVNDIQMDADAKVQRFMKGEDVPIHDVMVELGKAETSLRLMTTVIQKVIKAYNEVARMQV